MWDGKLAKYDYLVKGKIYNNEQYALVKFKDDPREYHCVMIMAENSLPCLFDEIKFIFGLPKTGTCHIRYKRKTCILYRVDSINNLVLYDEHCEQEDICEDIENILLFKYIFHMQANFGKIRKRGNTFLSWRDDISNNKNYISRETIKLLSFDMKQRIRDITCEMDPITFRWKVEKIAQEIDKECIIYVKYLFERYSNIYN